MINRRGMMEAARYQDARLSELGDSIEKWAEHEQIDLGGLVYVAEQRALRLALIHDGKDPRQLSRTHYTSVNLSTEARLLLPTFAAAWVDGFGVGVASERRSDVR